MATVALGVSPDSDGNGVTPLVHRKAIGAQWYSTGIVTGLDVSGTNSLAYHVNEGVAVCQRNASDGKTVAYWQGGDTPQVAAGDPSNPRIDAVWITAHNKPEYSDSDNYVTVGVTQGAPSTNPVAPNVPSGCELLRYFRVPAGATKTGSATAWSTARYAIMVNGNLGELAEYWWKSDSNGAPNVGKQFFEMPIDFYVPTDRLIELIIQCNYSSVKGDSESSEWSVQFQMDGQDIPHAATNFRGMGAWETHSFNFITDVTKGRHTARLRTWLQHGAAPHFHYSNGASGYGGSQYIGRRFMIFDRGVTA